ncbi:MAG: ABC-type microcin C transport system duplicated ATPase subunit YejF [Paracoccaceae bacterium]|jgi:ABC-type microcin C transport system duplicated ATPase subunit YejF
MTNSPPLLEISNLCVTYWSRTGLQLRRRPFNAVKRANLTINAGQTLGLVGESGSGKSSIANTLLGLVPAESGTMRFDGTDLAALTGGYPTDIRKKIQAVFQDPYSSLNASMTVEQIVCEPLTVHTAMTAAHLPRYPHEFSGGQRQRIAIASALALEPKLIAPLLDPARQRARRAARRAAPAGGLPRDVVKGCTYRYRCPRAMARCHTQMPPGLPACRSMAAEALRVF